MGIEPMLPEPQSEVLPLNYKYGDCVILWSIDVIYIERGVILVFPHHCRFLSFAVIVLDSQVLLSPGDAKASI